MYMKKYFIIIPVLFAIYLGTCNFQEVERTNVESDKVIAESSNEDVMFVNVFYNDENNFMTLDDYVIGVLACEMPASFEEEALKAGSVAIRSFYLYKYNADNSYVATSSDQCFNSVDDMKAKWKDNYDVYYSKMKSIVDETKGNYLTYNGEVIESFYFSLSNGYTENLENVFSQKRPYLVSVDSDWDRNVSSYLRTISFSKSEFLEKLGLDYSDLINIKILDRSTSGRVLSLEVNGVLFKGTVFRSKLGLRSTDFDISVESDVSITTRGFGHGVGMSQYGANEMAKLGYSYEDILLHYYTGTLISKI